MTTGNDNKQNTECDHTWSEYRLNEDIIGAGIAFCTKCGKIGNGSNLTPIFLHVDTELDSALGYAKSLARNVWQKHYREDSPQWKSDNTLVGVLSQLDNMFAGMTRLDNTLPIEKLATLLPGPYYMDPPDGGNTPIFEQLRRMSEDAAKYRAIPTPIAAHAGTIPEGWKLVPIEPTHEMLVAASMNCHLNDDWQVMQENRYKAMLTAAPRPIADSGASEQSAFKEWASVRNMMDTRHNQLVFHHGFVAGQRAAAQPVSVDAVPVTYNPPESAVRAACDLLDKIKGACAHWGGWSGTPSSCDEALNLLRYGAIDAPPANTSADAQTDPEQLARAERALTRAGYTYLEGAAEWKPPLGRRPAFIDDAQATQSHPTNNYLFKRMAEHFGIVLGKDTISEALDKVAAPPTNTSTNAQEVAK